MFRQIEVFETADRKRFDDSAKAREHVCDAIRAALDSRLNGLQESGRLSASDRLRVVMALVPDTAAVGTLHDTLTKWLDHF